MGHGIAQEFALAGFEVALHDLSDERLQEALLGVRDNLTHLAGLGVVAGADIEPALGRIHTTTALHEAGEGCDLVVEAVYEDLGLKQRIFRELDRACPPHAILASNSSTLTPGKLASTTQRPDKVLVAHYFNPPYLLPLVEIVRGPETSAATVELVWELLAGIGKTPVLVRKAVPGFIGNRLQMALLREALSIVEQGIATPQDVDCVIRNSFGRRLAAAGVFEIFEIAGWDLVLTACSNLLPEISASKDVPQLLKDRVDRKELGIKTGKGFYEWTESDAAALKERIADVLLRVAQTQRTQP